MLRHKELRAALNRLCRTETAIHDCQINSTRKGHVRVILTDAGGRSSRTILPGSGSDAYRGLRNGIAQIRRDWRQRLAQPAADSTSGGRPG